MKLIMLLSFASCAFASTAKWSQMTVKFGATEEGNDVLFLWKVQNTLTEALQGRWKKVLIENDLNVQFVGVEDRDHGFNPFYDRNGNLAGAQLCEPMDVIKATGPPAPFDPLAGDTNKIFTISGRKHYCSRFLIVDPDTVRKGRNNMTPFATGLWLMDVNSKTGYKQLPTDINKLLAETPFKQQGCLDNMGTHYVYNLTRNYNCLSLYGWVPMGVDNDITSLAWQIFGLSTNYHYYWHDFITKRVGQLLAPNAPECFYDMIDKYTLTFTHVFFTKNTWDITCPM